MPKIPDIKDFEKISFLKETALCNKFTSLELENFSNLCKFQYFLSGETIFSEGSKFDSTCNFYFVFKGDLQVTKIHTKIDIPKSMLINILKSGDSFGEIAILQSNNTRTATVKCITDSILLYIEKKHFMAMYQLNRKIADNLIGILIGFLNHSNALTRYVMFSSRDASCRLGFMIDFLRIKYGEPDGLNRFKISIPFNNGLIAEFLGMKPQLFSRCRKDLTDRGLISGYGRIFIIADYIRFKAFLN